jgi:hypothetical protein
VRQRTPEAFDRLRPSLVGVDAEPVLARIGRKRAHPSTVPVGVGLAVALLAGGLVLGLEVRDSAVARAIADAVGTDDDSGDDGLAEGSTAPTPAAPTPTGQGAPALLGLVPDDVRDSCETGSSDAATGMVASVNCSPDGSQPEAVSLYAYQTPAAMSAAFEQLAGPLGSGDCSTGAGRGTWTYGGVTQGPLACYESASGHTTILWGSDARAVLVLPRDSTWSPSALYTWWLEDAPYLG